MVMGSAVAQTARPAFHLWLAIRAPVVLLLVLIFEGPALRVSNAADPDGPVEQRSRLPRLVALKSANCVLRDLPHAAEV